MSEKMVTRVTISNITTPIVIGGCCLVFCSKAGSLCLVYSIGESFLLNTNKARAHLYGGAPGSFQTENSYILGIEPGIARTEVRVDWWL